jgi:hypothetical protein
VLINKEAWQSAPKEEKLQLCDFMNGFINHKEITHDDYEAITEFLLDYIYVRQTAI